MSIIHPKNPTRRARDGAYMAFGIVLGIMLTMLFHALLGVY